MAVDRDRPSGPNEMPAVASPIPSDHPEEDPNRSTPASEGSRSTEEEETQHSGTPAGLTLASLDPVAEPPEAERKEVVVSGPTEAHAGGVVENTPADPAPLKPTVEEAVPTLGPEREEDPCPDVPHQGPTSLSLPPAATDETVQAGEMPPPASLPPKVDSRSVLHESGASRLFSVSARLSYHPNSVWLEEAD